APVAERLGSLFSDRQASLVVADTGAHVVQPGARNAYVLHNSLLYWHASFALGQWAAANLGGSGFVASCVCDAGYDTVYAFRRGVESAGRTIVGDGVPHRDPADVGIARLLGAGRSWGAHLVYGLYSGTPAARVVRAYAASGLG